MSASSSQPTSPAVRGRTLVLCFDGTTNEYDGDNTDVVNFFSLLKKDNCDEQLCYYQSGIGTYFAPGVVSPLFQWCAKILDEAIAWYLDAHVMNGYKFICQNYQPGDKICLFGFSRGAYTARAVAGMLYKIGLLPRDNDEQINFAYKLYTRTDDEGIQLAQGFKQTFSQDVKIDFVGVWDTVASVGVIMGKSLPFTDSNTAIRTFRHALSLDERRARFRPNQYHFDAPTVSASKHDPSHASTPGGTQAGSSVSSKPKRSLFKRKVKRLQTITIPADTGPTTDVKEVWFVGCHSDVGGGAVLNSVKSNLSGITLRWMVREIVESQCGILFDTDALIRLNIPLNPADQPTLGNSFDVAVAKKMDQGGDVISENGEQTSVTSESADILKKTVAIPSTVKELDSGGVGDIVDALQPIHDQLSIKTTWQAAFWWILEIVPTHYSYQDATGVWHSQWTPNFGKGRNIQDLTPNFHVTVKERIEDPSLKYTPKAKWPKGQEVYVE